MDESDTTKVLIAVPPAVKKRWDELCKRARTRGAPTDEAEVDVIIVWADLGSTKKSR